MKWNIDFTVQLSVHRETIKTTAIMECEWVALMDDGWITLIRWSEKKQRNIWWNPIVYIHKS